MISRIDLRKLRIWKKGIPIYKNNDTIISKDKVSLAD